MSECLGISGSNFLRRENFGRQIFGGLHQKFGEETVLKFAANALNHFELHSRAVRDNLAVYAIFEDDLIPASALAEVNKRIVNALDEWPADGDTLYLELCFESCQNPPSIAYSPTHPNLFRAAYPHCTAAVVYRQKAAHKIVRLIRPAFMSIDAMLAGMVHAGTLKAVSLSLSLSLPLSLSLSHTHTHYRYGKRGHADSVCGKAAGLFSRRLFRVRRSRGQEGGTGARRVLHCVYGNGRFCPERPRACFRSSGANSRISAPS